MVSTREADLLNQIITDLPHNLSTIQVKYEINWVTVTLSIILELISLIFVWCILQYFNFLCADILKHFSSKVLQLLKER